jgi:phosphate/sulfate permease
MWVILSAHAVIGLGTMSGGWRIVRTMGTRLTKFKPRGGYCAETGAALSILVATAVNQPVSTTPVIAGAIEGVGSVQRLKAVRWGLAANIVGVGVYNPRVRPGGLAVFRDHPDTGAWRLTPASRSPAIRRHGFPGL